MSKSIVTRITWSATALIVVIFSLPAFAQTESANTIKASPVVEPTGNERLRWPFEFGGSVTVETAGTVAEGTSSNFGSSYVFKPTVAVAPWNLSASLQVSYNQSFTPNTDTNDVPPGNFDSHVINIAKAFDQFSIGILGALPANQAARDLSYDGSAGSFLKKEMRWHRLTFTETGIYQHRFYQYDINADETRNAAEVVKTLTEISYDVGQGFAISSSALASFALDPGLDYGIRTQVTVDYKPLDKFTTTLGMAIERGLSSLEGVGGKSDQAQAFLDLVVDL